MFKGIAPVAAIILLIGVTIGGIISAYIGITSLTDDLEHNIEKSIIKEFDARGANLKVDVFGNCKIYLRNTGTKDIPLEAIDLYIDDQPVNYEPSTGIIKMKNVTEISFSGLTYKRYNVKINLMGKLIDQGYMICSGGAPVYDFSCSIKAACNAAETEVLALSDLTNGFAELVGGNYSYKLCCENISSVKTELDTDCSNSYTGLITLSKNTNAFVEDYGIESPSGFSNKTNICVEFNNNARLECARTTSNNCDSWNWKKLVSFSGATNANIGNISAYPNNVLCCTIY